VRQSLEQRDQNRLKDIGDSDQLRVRLKVMEKQCEDQSVLLREFQSKFYVEKAQDRQVNELKDEIALLLGDKEKIRLDFKTFQKTWADKQTLLSKRNETLELQNAKLQDEIEQINLTWNHLINDLKLNLHDQNKELELK